MKRIFAVVTLFSAVFVLIAVGINKIYAAPGDEKTSDTSNSTKPETKSDFNINANIIGVADGDLKEFTYIDVGSAHGVKPGQRFFVSSKYGKVMVEVVQAFDKMSSVKVVDSYLLNEGQKADMLPESRYSRVRVKKYEEAVIVKTKPKSAGVAAKKNTTPNTNIEVIPILSVPGAPSFSGDMTLPGMEATAPELPGTELGLPGGDMGLPGMEATAPGLPGGDMGLPGMEATAPGLPGGDMGLPGMEATAPGLPGAEPGLPGGDMGLPGMEATAPGLPGAEPGLPGGDMGLPGMEATAPGLPGAEPALPGDIALPGTENTAPELPGAEPALPGDIALPGAESTTPGLPGADLGLPMPGDALPMLP